MTSPTDDPRDEVTVLDPGRQRPGGPGAADDETELDPGRRRPGAAGGPTVPGGLPAELDARFKIVRVLHRADERSAVYVVQDRATGSEQVLKLYRDAGPDPRVWAYLRRQHGSHLVRFVETGTADGRPYELMEYLAGGSLGALRAAEPAGLDPPALRAVVGQVARALVALHREGIVHRDVKPANIVVRTLSPFEVALVDFGISQYVPDGGAVAGDWSGTVRYMPPEFIGGRQLSPAYDWWSLGISVLELATGRRLLEGVDDDNVIRAHITGGPVNVSTIVDQRLRLLCQGLLAQRARARWGGEEVARWLRGESPPVPAQAAGGPEEVEAGEPFVYLDTGYRSRRLLAAAMTATWETAVALFHGDDPEPAHRLARWLAQFPGASPTPPSQDRAEPADVRLLRLLRRMSPQHPPVYRGVNISWQTLPDLARGAARGDGPLPAIVRELWVHDLLPLLAAGVEEAGLGGGDGLLDVRARWALEQQRWRSAAAQITDPEARELVGGHRRRGRTPLDDRMLALCLFAATVSDEEREEAVRELRGFSAGARVDWFSELLRRPDGLWLAYRLRDYADARAAERDEQERAAARRRAWLRRHQTLREWSRRQNRPLALSWAVAGVALMAVVCALLVAVSDVADVAGDSAILSAWLAVVFAAAVALAVEALLAWEIGGRFHPRYSILGAGMIALGRAARSVAGRGIALAVVVGLLGGAYLLTTYAPLVVPLLAGAGVLVWAVWRYLRWRTDSAREQEEIRQADQERLATAG